jgi:hypothetical protein
MRNWVKKSKIQTGKPLPAAAKFHQHVMSVIALIASLMKTNK